MLSEKIIEKDKMDYFKNKTIAEYVPSVRQALHN